MTTASTSGRTLPVPFVAGLFVCEAVVCTGFGLVLLAAPHLLLEVLGVEAAPAALLLARLFGTGLIQVAFLHAWQCRARSGPAMHCIVWGNVVQDLLAATVVGIGTLQGTLNALGWLLTAVFAAVAAANLLAVRTLGSERA